MPVEHLVTGQRLTPYDYTARIPEQIKLLDNVIVDRVVNPPASAPVDCYSFRHFTLYLHIASRGVGDHVLCIMPQFGITTLGGWHDYAQGLFAALCYEDVDTAAGIAVAFSGDCDGRYFRIATRPVAVESGKVFVVSAWVEFWS